ncbi:MAG: rhomboid family protein [Proteobacteria bacterium]|nr:rhomboid family protein [Pseudomonadota bacterium]
MKTLSEQRCSNHGLREAVARCPDCGRYFCRECITEHEEQVLCRDCLSAKNHGGLTHKKNLMGLGSLFSFAGGLMVIWLFFFYFGRFLLSLPASFHEGTLWKSLW